MTRVFPAEAYGVNGIAMTAATLISAFGLCGIPVALAQVHSSSEQTRLVTAATQLAVGLTLLCLIGVGVATLIVPVLPNHLTAPVTFLFPVLLLAHAAHRIGESLAIARGSFTPLAVGRVANAIVARGLTLGLGCLTHAGAGVMLLGDIVGRLVNVAVVVPARRRFWQSRFVWRPVDVTNVRSVLVDYRDFATHSNIAAALPTVTGLGIQTALGYQLGSSALGQYVLAQSILSLPVSLIAMSSAPVVFHRLVAVARETPDQLLKYAVMVTVSYAAVGTVVMLPITLFGPEIFGVFFGEQWRPAGSVAAALSLPQVLAFSSTAVLSMFRLNRRIRAWTALEFTGTVIVLGGLVALPAAHDLAAYATRLVILGAVYQLLMHAGAFWAANHARSQSL